MQSAPQQTRLSIFDRLEIPVHSRISSTGTKLNSAQPPVLSLVALFLRIVPQNHSLLAIVIFRFHLASGNLADVLSQDKEELVWYSIHHQLGVSPQVVSH
jgi:hypothetical protein